MKFNKLYNVLLTIGMIWVLLGLTSCDEHKYKIGASLCYHNDWNVQLRRDLLRGANSHPEMEMDILLTSEGVEKQAADIRSFVAKKVNAILINPESLKELTPVINEVAQSGIPIILIDKTNSACNYTASVCVDNVEVGNRMAQYAAYSTGSQGKVLLIMGLQNSSATIDRHDGFNQVLAGFPDLTVVDSCYTDWTYEGALPMIDSLLTLHPDVDVISTQSDAIAMAAVEACNRHHFGKRPAITGVDGLPGEGNGIESVNQGKISATCINPTGGLEAVNIALEILNKQPFQRDNKLKTQIIDKDNVHLYLQQEERVDMLNERIEELNGELGHYFKRSYMQQIFLIGGIILILLIIAFTIFAYYSFKQRAILRKKVEDSRVAKLNFFTNVSHSFRTPLTLIADPIDVLAKEGGLTARQQELLAIMREQTSKLLDLVSKVHQVLQDDLLKDGETLDAIAQRSVDDTIKASDFRNKSYTAPESIDANESRETILIIDDNADIRRYLEMVLEKRNYLILTAPNGEEGLHVAQQNIPDLVICDVMMPVMDGLECCRRLKEDQATSHIPVLLLTAYALDDQRIQGYRSGADAYITKPFNTDVLCARIENLIASRKKIDPHQETSQEILKAELSKIDCEFVRHFDEFVHTHIDDVDLDIQQLSDEFNMSRVQLYRKCKSLAGHSPVEIIRSIRLKAATEMLTKTDKTVSEIAYGVGFSSPSYFAKCYKDMFNESPTDVQKRSREGITM